MVSGGEYPRVVASQLVEIRREPGAYNLLAPPLEKRCFSARNNTEEAAKEELQRVISGYSRLLKEWDLTVTFKNAGPTYTRVSHGFWDELKKDIIGSLLCK